MYIYHKDSIKDRFELLQDWLFHGKQFKFNLNVKTCCFRYIWPSITIHFPPSAVISRKSFKFHLIYRSCNNPFLKERTKCALQGKWGYCFSWQLHFQWAWECGYNKDICKCDSLTGDRLVVRGAGLARCQLDFWCDWITGSRNSRMLGWIRNSLPSELRFPSLILKACICVLDMSICMVYSMSSNFPVSVILWEEVQWNSWSFLPKLKSPLSAMGIVSAILRCGKAILKHDPITEMDCQVFKISKMKQSYWFIN